jgi:hypothetical protein
LGGVKEKIILNLKQERLYSGLSKQLLRQSEIEGVKTLRIN